MNKPAKSKGPPKCVICGGEFALEESIHHGPFHEKCFNETSVVLLLELYEKFKRNLQMEAIGVHEGQFHYKCPMCGKLFSSEKPTVFVCNNSECFTVKIKKFL